MEKKRSGSTIDRPRKKLRLSSTANSVEVPPTSDHQQQALTANLKVAPGRGMSTADHMRCSDVLDKLMRHPAGRVFNRQLRGKVGTRVFELVDFETVKSNLENGNYATAEGFAEDVELTISTAMEYSCSLVGGCGHVQRLGREVRGLFRTEWSRCRTDLMKPQERVDVRIDKSTATAESAEISSAAVSSLSTSRADNQKAFERRSAGKIRIRIKYPGSGTGRRDQRSISRECVSDLHDSSAAARSSITSISRSSLEVSTDGSSTTSSVNSVSVRAALIRCRRSEIERQREAARRKIKAMSNSAGLMDNLESMFEFGKLLKGNQRYSCKVGPAFHR